MLAIDGNRGVLLLGLDLTTVLDHGNTHQREQVAGSVRVVVHATVEGCGHILADTHLDVLLTTRVLSHEIGDVVDNTLEQDPLLVVVLAGMLEILKAQNGKVGDGGTPLELGLLLKDTLLDHVKLTLADLVLGEGLQVRGKAKEGAGGDQPLGRVVLVKADGVAVVLRELMVEVVVALSHGDKGGDEVVAGGVAVIERTLTEPVGKRVDTEGGVMDKDETKDGGKEVASAPVTPAETSHGGGEDETHDEDKEEVVFVLPLNELVLVEVVDVSVANLPSGALDQHPANVGKEETAMGAVGVLLSVGPAVVSAVSTGPPLDGALNGASAQQGENKAQGGSCVVCAMCPQAMVSYYSGR